MKELQLTLDDNKKIVSKYVEIDIPTPKDNEVLIKVVVTGTNPKDWKYLKQGTYFNTGDDIAGTIESVGSKVVDFHKGDRVAAFHIMGDPAGSFAEYAIAPASTTFPLPESTSFEQAATIPLVILTSAIALYQRLNLPYPWNPATTEIPLVVYGGSSSVGLTALKLARLSNIHPLITIAGGSSDVIKKDNLADVILDYRNNDHLAEDIKKALGGKPLLHAFDAISEPPTANPLAEVLAPGGTITGILPYKEELPNGHKWITTYVGSTHKSYGAATPEDWVKNDTAFAYLFSRYVTKLLADGSFKTHPHEVVKGGLDGLTDGLIQLKEGKVRAKKLVARISETPNL